MATVLTVLVWVLVVLLFLAGLIGSIAPVLPGPPLIFLGIFIYSWKTDFSVISVGWLAAFAVLTGISLVLDYVFSVLAPRRAKASWWAVVGASVGLLFGVFFGLPGIILGPLLGATILEWLYCSNLSRSVGAGFSTFVGLLLGTAVKAGVSIAMIGVFLFKVLWGQA